MTDQDKAARLRDITEDDARAEGFLNRAHFLTAFGAMYPGVLSVDDEGEKGRT